VANNTPPAGSGEMVKITDVLVGKNKRVAEAGDTVWMEYTGKLKNGSIFDTNANQTGDPYSFVLGTAAVIKGWDQGIPGMHVGGVRKLDVPASLGYAEHGQGKIPPNSELFFSVKLLGLMKPGEEGVIDHEEVKVGSGREAKEGDTVTIQYTAATLNEKVFESSHGKAPYSFKIGQGKTLTSIEEGVKGMKVGGIRKVFAPPQTAYMSTSVKPISPNQEVLFTIELVNVK
jgi:FKBP-type peptidyl-prolyl cis-trans isomerase